MGEAMSGLMGLFGSGGAPTAGAAGSPQIPPAVASGTDIAMGGTGATPPSGKSMPGADTLSRIPWMELLKMVNPSVKAGPAAIPETPPLGNVPLAPPGAGPVMASTAPVALAQLGQIGPTLSAGGGGGQTPEVLALLRLLGGRR